MQIRKGVFVNIGGKLINIITNQSVQAHEHPIEENDDVYMHPPVLFLKNEAEENYHGGCVPFYRQKRALVVVKSVPPSAK